MRPVTNGRLIFIASLFFSGGCRPTSPAPQPSPRADDASQAAHEEVPLREDEGKMTYKNPILPGTNPDPSITRVGEDYYLVTSSFEYFPGVPIYHSRDLVHFTQLGYVLSRPTQLRLEGLPSSQGIYAPTLRHHEGTFYLVTTNMSGGGSFLVTATDPKGPWSEPIWIEPGVFTMDPSLFFDDDGKVYYTRHGEGERGGIFQAEIDVETGALESPIRKIWSGTGGVWPEGPHLYKNDGTYYLLISEGGTSYEHKITVARSDKPFGPFQAYAGNPILTHEHLKDHPIQATGHGDLVQTKEGTWWMVLLGIRPSTPGHHHIGRETFLAPVTWKDGWPLIANPPLELEMSTEGLPPPAGIEDEPDRDEFDSPELSVAWRHVRNPKPEDYSLTERPGFLRLRGRKFTLKDVASPTLLVRPQTAHHTRISTEVHAEPNANQEAGLVVRGNEKFHHEILVTGEDNGERSVVVRTTIAGKTSEIARKPLQAGPIRLGVDASKSSYEFWVQTSGADETFLGSAPTAPLGYETSQSFTGAFVGLYSHSSDASPLVADFAWFEMATPD